LDTIPISALLGVLLIMLLLSGFFSGTETALMTLNRYRVRHLAEQGHGGARRAARLLERPDRLIGVILLGNSFANILASSIATVIALKLWGERGIAPVAAMLTLLVLIFAEVAPKTLAALRPEPVAFPAAYVYGPLLRLLYPLVWAVNGVANGLLRAVGVATESTGVQALSKEELRTVVLEAGAMIPERSRHMLLGILDLERACVEDIMVPRSEVYGIDLQQPMEDTVQVIRNSPYSVIPLYDGGIDNVVGLFHARNAMQALLDGPLTKDRLRTLAREPYFIPEGTALYQQLLSFQRSRRRTGLVVDEYGDFLGLVTLSDLLEEIVGEFTTDPADTAAFVYPQPDGSLLIDGGAALRDLNRRLGWALPTEGPKTLNGLILEYLETIPKPGTSLKLHGYPLEIIQIADNAVKTVRYQGKVRGRQHGVAA
jgi:magnesium and cobalt exporter, CNNM family